MAIQYVGGQVAGRAGIASTTSVTFALTGGLASVPAAGDLVIITAVVGSQARNPAQAISGYTALGQLNPTATTYDTSMNVSWKFMGGTPDTTFTLPSTGNVADAQRYTVQVFRGVDQTTPLDVAVVSATGTATSRCNPASITPTTAGAWVVICGGGAAATGVAYTAPANFTTNFLTGFTADTNDALVGSGYWSGWTSGAVDPAVYTGGSTATTSSWAAYTIALRPAGDTTAPTLTSPTATVTGTTTATGTVSTDEANGTLYWLASANSTELVATVKAGSSQAVTATGSQGVSVSGLTSGSSYYLHYVHTDEASNDSALVTSAQFTTWTVPTITAQPTNQSASVGATATFTATIAGTTPMSWKWQILTP